MPGPFDGRTKHYKRLVNVGSALAGVAATHAGQYVYNKASGAISNYLSSRSKVSSRSKMSARYYRARRSRFRRRKTYRRQRRVGKVRSRRYTTSKRFARRNPPLRVNFGTNDYRKLRVVKSLGQILVTEVVPSDNVTRFHCHMSQFYDDWQTIIDQFEEFKLSNIQFVVSPRSVGVGASRFQVATGEIPYLAVREIPSVFLKPALMDATEVRQTPGFKYIPLMKKSRTVIGVKPQLRLVEEVQTDGTNIGLNRYKPLPWMNNAVDTRNLDVASIDIRNPYFDVGQGNQLAFDVHVYATLHLRGNTSQLISPL